MSVAYFRDLRKQVIVHMPSLLGAATEFRSVELGASPRSVTPGRQRWDVKLVLGRPRTAEILAAALRHIPGITEAQANPVTGGVLVRHDARLRATDIGRIIRRVVTRVAEEPAAAGRPAPVRPAPTAAPRADRGLVVRPVLAVGGGVAAGVALVKGSALSRQLVAASGVAVATAVVLRKAWRGTADTSRNGTELGAERHPLLEIVGPHRRRLYRAAALSVACQATEIALGTFLGWTGLVLIKGEAAPLVSLGLTTASAQLWGLAGLVAVACAAVAGLSYASNLQWRRLGQDIEHEWRSRTYRHVQHLELGHLEERTSRVSRRAHQRRRPAGRLLQPARRTTCCNSAPAWPSWYRRSSCWHRRSPGSRSCRSRSSPGCRCTTRRRPRQTTPSPASVGPGWAAR